MSRGQAGAAVAPPCDVGAGMCGGCWLVCGLNVIPHDVPPMKKDFWLFGVARILIPLATAFLLGAVDAAAVTVGSHQCDLVSDHHQKNVPSIPKPGYLEPIIDPVFGTTITRITGDPDASIPYIGSVWGQNARHHYSKVAAWNADQTLIILEKVDGVSGELFLHGESYEPLFEREGVSGEMRWHPTHPDIMNYVTTSCIFGRWNVRSDTQRALMRTTGYADCQLGPWEGNFSFDGNRAVAHALRTSDGKSVAFAVDLSNQEKYPDIVLADYGVTNLDWASISALGDYVVINGVLYDDYRDATMIFDLKGTIIQQWTEYGRPSHYDLSVDAYGNEVAVGVSKSRPDKGLTIMRRLADGVVTPLTVGGWSSHHSTRNYDLPHWAFVSHWGGDPPYLNELFAVKLDDSLTIARLASTHTSGSTYLAETHAVPSPDGTRVIFASDWEQDNGVQAYVVDLRPLCTAAPVPRSAPAQRKG